MCRVNRIDIRASRHFYGSDPKDSIAMYPLDGVKSYSSLSFLKIMRMGLTCSSINQCQDNILVMSLEL
ncbi:hypothetical protein EUGRSUZ_H04296 [Eucalyptus grandis]|uniref:Uncharacterized protein n=2 Tax=Eucalyptus grandis TaxID=71139 RepID=A0ACC3JWB3_EUCGR|nr:hypothetical protein EUGRSUZ_H04296 [Eucalyptus grandis]